jgi:hypothetical protein
MKLDTNIPDEPGRLKAELHQIPEELQILPLRRQVAFPTPNMTLTIHNGSAPLIEAAMRGDRLVGLSVYTIRLKIHPHPSRFLKPARRSGIVCGPGIRQHPVIGRQWSVEKDIND